MYTLQCVLFLCHNFLNYCFLHISLCKLLGLNFFHCFCRMNWTWLTRIERPCLHCPMRRNGRSTAARRRWVSLWFVLYHTSALILWLAFCWLAAWSHSLEPNVNLQWRGGKKHPLTAHISASNFFFDVNMCTCCSIVIGCDCFWKLRWDCGRTEKSICAASSPLIVEQAFYWNC